MLCRKPHNILCFAFVFLFFIARNDFLTDLLSCYYYFFMCLWAFDFHLLHLNLTCTPHCTAPSTSSGMSISGIYSCCITNRNMQNYRNTRPGGIPCTNASNTHPHRIIHAKFFICLLSFVMGILACSATHTRPKGQGISSNTD